jgi:hypothetical protein
LTGQIYKPSSAEGHSCLRGGGAPLPLEGTARRVREEAEARGLSVDELISSLMAQGSRSSWLTRRTCGARVKPEDMELVAELSDRQVCMLSLRTSSDIEAQPLAPPQGGFATSSWINTWQEFILSAEERRRI